jgi:hypothetical protein
MESVEDPGVLEQQETWLGNKSHFYSPIVRIWTALTVLERRGPYNL